MKTLIRSIILTVATFFGYSVASFAAVDAAVSTALADAKTDSLAIAALVFIVLVALAAYKFMKKAL